MGFRSGCYDRTGAGVLNQVGWDRGFFSLLVVLSVSLLRSLFSLLGVVLLCLSVCVS